MYANEEKPVWLDKRKKGIGGTDAAAILGVSPWRTPVSVWLDKMGKSAPTPENEAMRIGTELEDYVARSYSRETGLQVRNHTRFVTDGGCLIGNIDRLVIPEGKKIAAYKGEIRTNRILECKTSSKEWADGVPLNYQVQVLHYMGLCPTVEVADVACLFLLSKHFSIYHVERDDELIQAMQTQLREWWQKHIINGEMPKPTSEDDCKALWSHSNPDKAVYASEDIRNAVAKLKAVNEAIKAAEDEAGKLRDAICAAMGDAESLMGNEGKPLVTWKSGKAITKTDYKAIVESLNLDDSVITRFSKTISFRRFIIK